VRSAGRFIPIEDWGRDHWSTFAYVETCVVDQQPLNRDRLRCNVNKRPHLVGPTVNRFGNAKWNDDYGTRLKGFFGKGKTTDKTRQLPKHDDWDCLEDFEEAGLIEIVSVINAIVLLTEKGIAVASIVRKHKALGGNFADFEFKPESLPV
jgi:hypothetical protein